MEKEAVAEIARMFGWETHLGHLTSGGTMANLEALWIAGELKPGATVARLRAGALHAQPHQRRAEAAVREHPDRRPAAAWTSRALEKRLKAGGVGTVVATLGTTAIGSVDPLPEILELRERYGFRLHADCAYGGYYVLADNLAPPARAAFDRLAEVDSIVIDPHKHGLQPYGCGCVLFRDPGRRQPLPPRLALHVLQLERAAPRRDQPRMLAAGRRRGRALGDAAAACRSCAAASSRSMLHDCRAAALEFHAQPGEGRRVSSRPSRPNSTSSSGPCARSPPRSPRTARARSSRRPKRPGLHLALAELPAGVLRRPLGRGRHGDGAALGPHEARASRRPRRHRPAAVRQYRLSRPGVICAEAGSTGPRGSENEQHQLGEIRPRRADRRGDLLRERWLPAPASRRRAMGRRSSPRSARRSCSTPAGRWCGSSSSRPAAAS